MFYYRYPELIYLALQKICVLKTTSIHFLLSLGLGNYHSTLSSYELEYFRVQIQWVHIVFIFLCLVYFILSTLTLFKVVKLSSFVRLTNNPLDVSSVYMSILSMNMLIVLGKASHRSLLFFEVIRQRFILCLKWCHSSSVFMFFQALYSYLITFCIVIPFPNDFS